MPYMPNTLETKYNQKSIGKMLEMPRQPRLVLDEKINGPYFNPQIRAATFVFDDPPASKINPRLDAKIYDKFEIVMDQALFFQQDSLSILEIVAGSPR